MNRNPVTWSDILRLFGMFVFCERQRPTSTNGSHIENGSIWNATRTLLKHSRFSRGRWRFRVIPSWTVYVVHAVSVAVITPRVVVVYIRTIGTRPSVWGYTGQNSVAITILLLVITAAYGDSYRLKHPGPRVWGRFANFHTLCTRCRSRRVKFPLHVRRARTTRAYR